MIQYHHNITQGTDEWYAIRRGVLTASEMHLILTPTLKASANEKTRQHVYELMAQRMTGYVEPAYVGDDMIRGQVDEIEAKTLYAEHYGPLLDCGFVTNDEWGFTIGYSPDGLVGADGLIEVKSRRQKYQAETIIAGQVPSEYMIQIQTGLLVTRRKWCDFISYCGGLYMMTIRVFPDDAVQAAIIEAASAFEKTLAEKMSIFNSRITSKDFRILKTERKIEQEITV